MKQAQQPADKNATCPPRLTPRENEVLKGIVEGLINKEIAARMGVSVATVITHRKNLTEKLGTRSVSALTFFEVAYVLVRSEFILELWYNSNCFWIRTTDSVRSNKSEKTCYLWMYSSKSNTYFFINLKNRR